MPYNDLSDLIGLPYESIGDCWNLCRIVTERQNISLPDYTINEDFRLNKKIVEAEIDKYQKLDKPVPWCIVLYRCIYPDGIHYHTGVVLPCCTKFIHAHKSTGVCITRLNNPLYFLMRQGFYWPTNVTGAE